MNYNKNRYQNDNNINKRKQMEDEMNKFEKEICDQSNFNANYQQQQHQSNQKSNLPAMFIPHQLKRQQNVLPNSNQRPLSPISLANHPNFNLQSNVQSPFISAHLSTRPPPIPSIVNQSMITNTMSATGFKPIIQPPFIQAPNIHHNAAQQQQLSNTITKPSYTVTPMALPTNVHNVSNPVQPASNPTKKQKTNDSNAKNSNSKKQKKIIRTAGGTTWEG